MTITGTEMCHFFVYTAHRFYLDDILVDDDYWRYWLCTEIYLPSTLQ